MRTSAPILGLALVILAVTAPAAHALSPGDIVVADPSAFGGTGGLIKVNPKTGKERKLSANNQAVNSSSQLFSFPQRIAIDKKGKILVADPSAFGGTGGIIKVNPKTGKESKLSANDQPVNASSQLFSTPEGVAVDAKGKILVADQEAFGGTGGMIKVNPTTGKESKVSANDQAVNASHQLFEEPGDMALDDAGKILVADQYAFGGTGGIIKVNPKTGKESKLSANNQAVNASHQHFVGPVGIARDRKGKLLIADYDAFGVTGGVIKVNPKTGKESKLSANNQAVNASHQLFEDPVFLAIVP